MALNDWTKEQGTWDLYTLDKHSGNSCVQSGSSNNTLTRNNLSIQQATIIGWSRRNNYIQYNHPSYGDLSAESVGGWQKNRITFWYDSPNNTRWGKIERWITDAWVQYGTDTNFGSGSPSADTIKLKGGYLDKHDDVDVYD